MDQSFSCLASRTRQRSILLNGSEGRHVLRSWDRRTLSQRSPIVEEPIWKNVKHDFLLFEAKPCLRSPDRAVRFFSLDTCRRLSTVDGLHRAMAFGVQFPMLAARWLWWSRV